MAASCGRRSSRRSSLVVASLIVGVFIALPSGIIAAMKEEQRVGLGIDGVRHLRLLDAGLLEGHRPHLDLQRVPAAGSPPSGYVRAVAGLLEQAWWRLVLPAITLGTFFSGLVARIVRSSLLEVLDQDYIKAARARGVRQASLVYRHGLANALIPVVTVIGLQFGALLGGAVLTETVFGIPGMGRLTVAAILEPRLRRGAGRDPRRRVRRGDRESRGGPDLRVPQPADPGGLMAQPLDADGPGPSRVRPGGGRHGRAGGFIAPVDSGAASPGTAAPSSVSRCSSPSC